MRVTLERAWYQGRRWPKLLLPLSGLYWGLDRLNRALSRPQHPGVPVIVVGNISVGGTGKSMFVPWLANWLQQQGKTVGIISRGYGVKLSKPVEVNEAHQAHEVGDEPRMMFDQLSCPIYVFPKRIEAAKALLAKHAVDVIISDDGLQHYGLARDIEIVLLDGQRGLGNGYLLPAGPLRETPARLKSVNWVLAKGSSHPLAQGHFALTDPRFSGLNTQQPLAAGTPVQGLCALANPDGFFASLGDLMPLAACHAFGDHHPFALEDLANLGPQPLVISAKDAIKIKPFCQQVGTPIYVLTFDVKLDNLALHRLTELVDHL